MTPKCGTCQHTGRWAGEPAPCPECGSYFVKTPVPPDLRKYRVMSPGPNRRMRRAAAARERKQR